MESKENGIQEIIYAILGDVAHQVSEKELLGLMGFNASKQQDTGSTPAGIKFFVLDDELEAQLSKKGAK
jgi:hypothetical protein